MTRLRPKPPGEALGVPTAASITAIARTRATSSGHAVPVSPPVNAASIERRSAVAVLVLAVALGGILRFCDLGGLEMSADEGSSWAAASASSVSQVLQLQPQLNPGKFAVHELALHEWILLFGDGLAAMRALSAMAGTLGIVVVFFLARDLFGLSPIVTRGENIKVVLESTETPSYVLPAAFAAMLFAVNLVFIKYAREARMYSVAALFGLMQIDFFLRSLRCASDIGARGSLASVSNMATGQANLPSCG
jgi:hypothetical protein